MLKYKVLIKEKNGWREINTFKVEVMAQSLVKLLKKEGKEVKIIPVSSKK